MTVGDMVAFTARSTDVVENRRGLIQTHGSFEFPAMGHWTIPGGQRLDVTERWPWSRRRLGFTTSGRLDIPFDPFAMQLELTLTPGGDRRLPTILCVASLVEADRLGDWTFTGSALVGDRPIASIVVQASYQGVYDHGAQPVALLRIGTRLPPPAYTPRRGRPRARVDVLGTINACRLDNVPGAVTTAEQDRQLNDAAYSGDRWNISNWMRSGSLNVSTEPYSRSATGV